MVALSVFGAALTLGAVAVTPMPARSAEAKTITLYTDPASGQVYTKRCKHCVKLGEYIPAGSTEEIERKVEQRVTQQTQAQLDQERAAMAADAAAKQTQQQQWNAEMAKQVSEIQPFAREFGDRWYKKISIGTLVYADYRFYSHTGFGPQFLTQEVWPGPGNNTFNSFDITRTYLDFKFTPIDDVSMRVTPNMYLIVNTGSKCSATSKSSGGVTTTTSCTASGGDPDGLNTGWAQTSDGNLGFRLKYAYMDYNTFFQKILNVPAMHDDKITFGQQQNPLVDWEENLWGFRYTALTPWNYLSLSSSQVGLALKGPIKVNDTQYADYDLGVYDDASFHATEQDSTKQVMGRVTINPFGAKSRYDSFGLTGFYDYGYSNKCTPDSNSVKGNNSTCGHIARAVALAHYTAATWGLIGEWDYGHNAFSSGNLYSGSGPSDAIGIASPAGLYGQTSFKPWNSMVGTILNTQAVQMGWDFMGHYDIPHTPFTAFGLFQQFLPNTRIGHDPLDFERYDVGVQWLVNKYLRVALDSQAIQYYQKQFTYGEPFGPGMAKKQTFVPYAVPRDTHAFFLNLEFKY
jgi:hypothetical protein